MLFDPQWTRAAVLAGFRGRSIFRAGVLMSIALVSLPPLLGEEPAPTGRKGVKIEGKVSFADGKPALDAIVTAIHLESGKDFKAEPTHSSGRFEIAGVPYGYYLFAIEAKGVLHASALPFNVPPGNSQDVAIVLREPLAEAEAVTVPGIERKAEAMADAQEPKKSFFKRPAGIATIVAASLLTLLLRP